MVKKHTIDTTDELWADFLQLKIRRGFKNNDLALETIKNWGIPVLVDKAGEKRSLWATAANAPVSLITSVSLMIIAIWYIIFYIVFKLYKISKIKPLKS